MSNLTKVLILLGIGLFLAAASIWFIGGKKKDYDARATIKARPYQLFPYLVEPEQKARWMQGLIQETVVSQVTEESDASMDDVSMVKEESNLDTIFEIDGKQVAFKGQVIRLANNEVAAFKYRSEEMKRTAFFRLKDKGDQTELEYRRIVQLSGLKRFLSVFQDDNNQQVINEEVKRLIELVEGEVDNTIPDPNKAQLPVELEPKQPVDPESQLGSLSRESESDAPTAKTSQGSDTAPDDSNKDAAEPAYEGNSDQS